MLLNVYSQKMGSRQPVIVVVLRLSFCADALLPILSADVRPLMGTAGIVGMGCWPAGKAKWECTINSHI